jgi:hypothetical protein
MSSRSTPSPAAGSQVGKSSPMTGSMGQGQGHVGAPIPHEKIAKRAYEKWCQRGCPQGTDQQDWHEAENELRAEMTGKGPQMAQPMGGRPGQAPTPTSMPQKSAQQRR